MSAVEPQAEQSAERETAGRPPPPTRLGAARRPGRQRRPVREAAFRLALLGCLSFAVVFLVTLLAYLVAKGWPRLDSRLWQNFPSAISALAAGARSAILGTVWVISFTAVFCVPTGVMAAIYLEEYADTRRWYNRVIELNIQNLAAVPSIVYGILGLALFVRAMRLGSTVLAASLTLSLLVLPIVIISAREAIRAVPDETRQGSYALGATRWQTIWRQVLPQAIPGMATGSILALSRAIGEAAPLLLIGVASFVMFTPTGLNSTFTALPVQIYNWIALPDDRYATLASAAIVVLLVILLAMNSFAILLRNRFQKRN